MSDLPPVTFGIKVTKDLGHVHFNLFAGRTPDARGCAGSLVMRPDEFHEFLRRLNPERLSDATAEVVHARDGAYFMRNRCGLMGGLATNDAEATCEMCRAVIDGAVRDGG